MNPASWPCPLPGGGISDELALVSAAGGSARLLIIPALFDEGNKLRRQCAEVMRRLAAAGIDSVMPDLPGCNESSVPLEHVTPDDWRDAAASAARHFGATHVLALRGGGLLMPANLPGWRYAPVDGAAILRQLMRVRIIASREMGLEETREALMDAALEHGIELAGYRLSADFIHQFQKLRPEPSDQITAIDQDMVGGSGLWLRAEPGEDRKQADALAAIVAIGIRA